MKKIFATSAAAVLLVVAGVATAQAGVNLSVHLGVPVVAPAPPVVPVTYSGYPAGSPWQVVQPDIYLDEAPSFIYSPNLGFHVSVGIPYDIAYINNSYYLYRGGSWYLAPSYSGPWSMVSYRRLPPPLHRHRYEQIRHYRDHEYRSYLHDRDRYRGNWHHPRQIHAVGYRDGYSDGYRKHRMEHRKDHGDGDRREHWKGRGGRWDRDDRWGRDGRWDGRRGHERWDR